MKSKKKILSLFMSFIMVLSIISSIPMKANAGMDSYEVGHLVKYVTVNKGDTVVLSVDNPSEIYEGEVQSCYWTKYRVDELNYGSSEYIDNNSTSYEITDIQEGGRYECEIDYGYDWDKDAIRIGIVVFYVVVGNDFGCDEGTDSSLSVGESTTLTVNASTAEGNTLSYRWFRSTGEVRYSGRDSENVDSLAYTRIDNANEVSYTTSQAGIYRCMVTDNDGNIAFPTYKVTTNNNFNVATQNQTVTVTPGVETMLSVDASCDTPLTYIWEENSSELNGVSGSTYSLTIPTEIPEDYQKPYRINCTVKDEYGNEKTVTFWINVDNKLQAEASNVVVKPDEKATLQVNAKCLAGNLHYQWYQWVEIEDGYRQGQRIEGATLSSYETETISKKTEYYCEVSDDFGNCISVTAYALIDNKLTCSAEEENIGIKYGEKATLKVNASCENGELTYKWSSGSPSADTPNILVVSPSSSSTYYCTVSDQYGNEEMVTFNVSVVRDIDLDENTICLLCWDGSGEKTYQKIVDANPELADKITILNLEMGGTDPDYIATVKSLSEKNKVISAADVSLLDELFASDNFISMEEVGITKSDYKYAYPYTKEKGTYNGKLMAMTSNITTGNLIYRTDIAEKVFGTSDPDEVEQLLNTPENFLVAAKKLKDAGYYAFSENNFYYNEYDSESIFFDDCVFTDEERESAHEFGKALIDNGYTHGTNIWESKWSADMKSDNVFAYSGCTWFNFVYLGDWDNVNYCQGPIPYFWGGSYYLASSKCKGDATVQAVLKALCCDADMMESINKSSNEIPNNSIALKNMAEKEDAYVLSSYNQNVYAFYDRLASAYRAQENQPDIYTIDYVLNGGVNHADNPTEYDINSSVTLKNPTRKGYLFNGWYTDEKYTSAVVTTVANGDVTLYAKWTPISYTIHFDKNGAISGSMKRVYPKYDRYYRLPACGFQKPGYLFAGWNTRRDGKGTLYRNQSNVRNLTTVNGKVIILYAQWRKVSVATASKPSLGNYAAGRLTVAYNEVSGATGYLIQYSTNKNMKNAKNVSSTTVKRNIYGLKKGVTYYVRVRAYKVDSAGKKVYGRFSSIQYKKITK